MWNSLHSVISIIKSYLMGGLAKFNTHRDSLLRTLFFGWFKCVAGRMKTESNVDQKR